jgi:hypothetical protein
MNKRDRLNRDESDFVPSNHDDVEGDIRVADLALIEIMP